MIRPTKNNQVHTGENNPRKDRQSSRVILLRIAVIIVLLGIGAITGIQAEERIQTKKMDQRLSSMVSEAVAQTLTQASFLIIETQTPPVIFLPTSTPKGEPSGTGPWSSTPSETVPSNNQSDELCSPIEGVPIKELKSIISQDFNVPNQLSDMGHHGVDLGSYNFHGQYLFEIPVRAILAGEVAGITVDRPPIGNVVILETKYEDLPVFLRNYLEMDPGQSLYHFYGHLVDEPTIEIGTHLECGEQINLLGKSRTVEAHLHLETRVGKSGLVINQMAFYDAATTEEERAEYLWWRTSGELTAVNPMSIFQAFLDQP